MCKQALQYGDRKGRQVEEGKGDRQKKTDSNGSRKEGRGEGNGIRPAGKIAGRIRNRTTMRTEALRQFV